MALQLIIMSWFCFCARWDIIPPKACILIPSLFSWQSCLDFDFVRGEISYLRKLAYWFQDFSTDSHVLILLCARWDIVPPQACLRDGAFATGLRSGISSDSCVSGFRYRFATCGRPYWIMKRAQSRLQEPCQTTNAVIFAHLRGHQVLQFSWLWKLTEFQNLNQSMGYQISISISAWYKSSNQYCGSEGFVHRFSYTSKLDGCIQTRTQLWAMAIINTGLYYSHPKICY